MERLSPRSIRWDLVVSRLQDLRVAAGEPSYADLARAVSDVRRSRGLDEHSSRVARTTVYDVFRPGRSRVNLDLVRDLAAALGASGGDVDDWIESARVEDPAPAPTQPIQPAQGEPAPAPAPERDEPRLPGPSTRLAVALVLACVAVNVLGRVVVDTLDLPIYLDMAGTAFAAIGLGPWVGAGVGVASNVLGTLSSGARSLPFAVVNLVGALVWGYGVRRGMARTLPRFFVLNLLVALVCTLVAVPILVIGFSGTVGQGEDALVANLEALGQGLLVSVAGGNLLASLADKTISGFVALVALSCFTWAPSRGLELLPDTPRAVEPRG